MGLEQADSASILRTPLGEIIWHSFSPLEATRGRAGKFPVLAFVAPDPIPPAFSSHRDNVLPRVHEPVDPRHDSSEQSILSLGGIYRWRATWRPLYPPKRT
jgi:hypothetical protein